MLRGAQAQPTSKTGNKSLGLPSTGRHPLGKGSGDGEGPRHAWPDYPVAVGATGGAGLGVPSATPLDVPMGAGDEETVVTG